MERPVAEWVASRLPDRSIVRRTRHAAILTAVGIFLLKLSFEREVRHFVGGQEGLLWGFVIVAAVGAYMAIVRPFRNDLTRALRENAAAEGLGHGIAVRLDLSRGDRELGEDVGWLALTSDALVFSGRRVYFGVTGDEVIRRPYGHVLVISGEIVLEFEPLDHKLESAMQDLLRAACFGGTSAPKAPDQPLSLLEVVPSAADVFKQWTFGAIFASFLVEGFNEYGWPAVVTAALMIGGYLGVVHLGRKKSTQCESVEPSAAAEVIPQETPKEHLKT